MYPEEVFPIKWLNHLKTELVDKHGYSPDDLLDMPQIETESTIGEAFALGHNWAVSLIGMVFITSRFWESYQEYEKAHGAWYAKRQYFALYSHEVYHALEQREKGMFKYLIKYIPLMLRYGSRRGHPMERPAYALGDSILDGLQTEISEERLNGEPKQMPSL